MNKPKGGARALKRGGSDSAAFPLVLTHLSSSGAVKQIKGNKIGVVNGYTAGEKQGEENGGR
jgi:hypothetical protein